MLEEKKEERIIFFYNKHKELILEIFRFLLVGGLATLIDLIVYEICYYIIFISLNGNINLILSTTFGFTIGLIFNYIFSIIFVFKSKKNNKETKSIKSFILFTIIGVIGLGIKIGIQTGGDYLSNLIFPTATGFFAWFLNFFVYCFATLIVLVWNYIGRKLFIFKN